MYTTTASSISRKRDRDGTKSFKRIPLLLILVSVPSLAEVRASQQCFPSWCLSHPTPQCRPLSRQGRRGYIKIWRKVFFEILSSFFLILLPCDTDCLKIPAHWSRPLARSTPCVKRRIGYRKSKQSKLMSQQQQQHSCQQQQQQQHDVEGHWCLLNQLNHRQPPHCWQNEFQCLGETLRF